MQIGLYSGVFSAYAGTAQVVFGYEKYKPSFLLEDWKSGDLDKVIANDIFKYGLLEYYGTSDPNLDKPCMPDYEKFCENIKSKYNFILKFKEKNQADHSILDLIIKNFGYGPIANLLLIYLRNANSTLDERTSIIEEISKIQKLKYNEAIEFEYNELINQYTEDLNDCLDKDLFKTQVLYELDQILFKEENQSNYLSIKWSGQIVRNALEEVKIARIYTGDIRCIGDDNKTPQVEASSLYKLWRTLKNSDSNLEATLKEDFENTLPSLLKITNKDYIKIIYDHLNGEAFTIEYDQFERHFIDNGKPFEKIVWKGSHEEMKAFIDVLVEKLKIIESKTTNQLVKKHFYYKGQGKIYPEKTLGIVASRNVCMDLKYYKNIHPKHIMKAMFREIEQTQTKLAAN